MGSGGHQEIIDFRDERVRHEDLFGREDLLKELDDLLLRGAGQNGWVLVQGGPGTQPVHPALDAPAQQAFREVLQEHIAGGGLAIAATHADLGVAARRLELSR